MNAVLQAAAGVARFVKIGADGTELAADAAEWVAVLDTTTNLLWSVQETDRMNWKKAQAYCAALELAGLTDWRLPSVKELFLLADRTKYSPAIDTAFFPECKSSWYWSGTADAESTAVYAWYVNFHYGSAYYYVQGSDYYVRAVRPRQ